VSGIQFRRYELKPGAHDDFLAWYEQIVPIRVRCGFHLLFALDLEEIEEFVSASVLHRSGADATGEARPAMGGTRCQQSHWRGTADYRRRASRLHQGDLDHLSSNQIPWRTTHGIQRNYPEACASLDLLVGSTVPPSAPRRADAEGPSTALLGEGYAWSRMPTSVPGGTIASIRSRISSVSTTSMPE
jgi:hypothetical protein